MERPPKDPLMPGLPPEGEGGDSGGDSGSDREQKDGGSGGNSGSGGEQKEGSAKDTESPDFVKFGRFGLLDNAFLIGPALAGFELEDQLTKFAPEAEGYGPLIGATMGNAVSNGLAGLTSAGPKKGAASFSGALLPLVPITAVAASGVELNTQSKIALGIASGALAAVTAYDSYLEKQPDQQSISASVIGG